MTPSKVIALKANAEKSTKQKIVDAAIDCFTRHGPQRTSMSDIAEAAGVSRKTLYRAFDDRSSLIEHMLVQRMQVQSAKVRRRLAKNDTFEELVVESSVVAVAAARGDTLFNTIVQNNTSHQVEQFLFKTNAEIFAGMCDLWAPTIELGRSQGKVRQGMSNEWIVEIIINFHSLLLLRDDYTPAKQRKFLREVLLPAIG